MRRPSRPLVATGVALVVLLAGCAREDGDAAGDGGDAPAAQDDDRADDVTDTPQPRQTPGDEVVAPEASADLGSKPTITLAGGGRPEELVTVDVVEGEGAEATPGSFVSVQYAGILADGGEPFDASWDRGQPFSFQLGAGMVIQGWDQGVEGMRVGGRRTLYVPADQAYGSSGRPGIPGDSDLVFVVDLLSVREPVTKADEPEVELPDDAPDELVTDDLVEGDGAEVVEGAFVELHYVGKAFSTDAIFDSSYDGGQPLSFRAGAGQLIPGFDQGVLGMREGGRRRIVIPPDLAYGEEGAGDVITPGETLVFIVDVVSVS